jgi:general stress protein CsbA
MAQASSAFVLLFAVILMMAFIGIALITTVVLAAMSIYKRVKEQHHEVGK